MRKKIQLICRLPACVLALLLLRGADRPLAQGPVPISDRHITYILPQWGSFLTATDAQFAAEVQQLRARIGEGPRVRVGFAVYIAVDMTNWTVDTNNRAAVNAALAGTIAQLDYAIQRARAHAVPMCVSFLTAIRGATDAAQAASQVEDRRTMQWHADNSMAAGWWSHSQYARMQRRVQEAYLRELGRVVASRMAANPATFVAASGDGEVELSYDRSVLVDPALTPATSQLADYSPFAVAEFRDWLRAGGLYAAGQPLAGQAYAQSARYAGDASPGTDSNGDGHTLNGDFARDFSSWELKHFNWSLADPIVGDPGAIGAVTYQAPGFNPAPGALPLGFDPPRALQTGTPWWDLWSLFRETMVWRHNLDVARWMTTSADPASGYTMPVERWFSDQIPADYLFGHTPQNRDFRLETSASPWWTADVSPYGSLGITAFNANIDNVRAHKTLAGVAPLVAARRVRWGILEWNPAIPSTSDPTLYREEMALVEQYRPSLLVPFMWRHPDHRVEDSGFEVALGELVARISTIPLTLSRSSIAIGATGNGLAQTPAQVIRVTGAPGEQPPWSVASASSLLTVQPLADGRSFSVALAAGPRAPGPYTATVVISSSDPGYAPVTLTVAIRVASTGTSTAPIGSFDTPAQNAQVSGEVAVTGWAVDDIGIAGVEIYRTPAAGESASPNGLVLVGAATLVEGARPDVETIHSTLPLSGRAGWGYMLLTNMLPSGGNGAVTLWAVARDYDGHTATLGSRLIEGRNSLAVLPFGTIDTPLQGQTVSGTIVNFGWALAPQPYVIPTNGSTIGVYVDGAYVGQPVYNNFRADIAGLFPGYANTAGPVGYFMLDTTRYANGVHTIAWLVRDSVGNAQGIGSRFFTIANP